MNAMETAKTINQKTKPDASKNVGENKFAAARLLKKNAPPFSFSRAPAV